MKMSLMVAQLLILAVAGAHARQGSVKFGPGACVSLDLSSAGTCVITTDCQGQDTADLEFAFDCESADDGAIMRHSFGRGGFDANEQFDTQLRCSWCSAPTQLGGAGATAQAEVATSQEPQEQAARTAETAAEAEYPAPRVAAGPGRLASLALRRRPPTGAPPRSLVQQGRRVKQRRQNVSHAQPANPPSIAAVTQAIQEPDGGGDRYGPQGCVATWRSEDGHCIMKTRCKGVNIDNYTFGFVCIDKMGTPVRHLFSKGSFDPEEAFDTLVACEQCRGLENVPDPVAMNGQVVALSQEMKSLETMVANMSHELAALQAKVLPRESRLAQRHKEVAADSGPKHHEVQKHDHRHHETPPARSVKKDVKRSVDTKPKHREVRKHDRHHHEAPPAHPAEKKVAALRRKSAAEVLQVQVDGPEPDLHPQNPMGSEEAEKATQGCVQSNGEFVDSNENTSVVIFQAGCDISVKWGPALTIPGKIKGDVVQLEYESWGNPSGRITNGVVTWQTANSWTWTSGPPASEGAKQVEPLVAATAKQRNLRSSNKSRHIEMKLIAQRGNELLAKRARGIALPPNTSVSKAESTSTDPGDTAPASLATSPTDAIAKADVDDDVLPQVQEQAILDANATDLNGALAAAADDDGAVEDTAAPAMAQRTSGGEWLPAASVVKPERGLDSEGAPSAGLAAEAAAAVAQADADDGLIPEALQQGSLDANATDVVGTAPLAAAWAATEDNGVVANAVVAPAPTAHAGSGTRPPMATALAADGNDAYSDGAPQALATTAGTGAADVDADDDVLPKPPPEATPDAASAAPAAAKV